MGSACKTDRVLAAARQNGGALTVPHMIELAGFVDTPSLRREVMAEVIYRREWRNVGNCPTSKRTLWKWRTAA